jgi:hypothetical protein
MSALGQKQTLALQQRMSALGHKRTSAKRHSIIVSAINWSDIGILRPIALAVLRLIAN